MEVKLEEAVEHKKKNYICPMHSEVVSGDPGNCPKCGMELVVGSKKWVVGEERQKKGHKLHETHDHTRARHSLGDGGEHHPSAGSGLSDHSDHHRMMAEDFKRRFFVVLPLTLIVLILSPKIQEWLRFTVNFPLRNLILFTLGSIISLYGGMPFFKAAKGELMSRSWGMMTLVSLAVLSGYVFSVFASFVFEGESLWWEISTLVLAFLFGHWMEMRAVLGTGEVLRELAKLIPPMAHRFKGIKCIKSTKSIKGAKIEEVATEQLQKGDFVLVKPGEKIPADGGVVEGESSVNEAMITGESKPVGKKKGDEVIGGTINNDGSLTVKVTKTGKESALSRIIELVRQAQETKPAVQKLADRAANWLTIIAIVIGSGTFIYWFFINPSGAIFAATLAITVIVITCPHALGLAIPTVTTITSSLAARNGILIRDMKGLDVARKLDYVVFDKTGTLTQGNFGVTKIIPVNFKIQIPKSKQITNSKYSNVQKEILKYVAAVEVNSEHTLAKAIVSEAKKRRIKFTPAKNFKAYPGKGAVGGVGRTKVVVGNKAMMEKVGIKTPKFQNSKIPSGTLVFVAKDKELLGAIILDDQVRPESKKAVDKLHSRGIKVAMLTGDKKEVADKVGKKLGIDTIFSEVLPRDKVRIIKDLQEGKIGSWPPAGRASRPGGKLKIGNSRQNVVAMVGDGVNDAPSLTQSHVGIAIGAGTDVAIESAEVVLVKNNPLDVIKVIELSRATDIKMKQNLAWATGYNLIAIPAAAGAFASFGIFLRPEWGALLMSASSIIVVANALRLRRLKL